MKTLHHKQSHLLKIMGPLFITTFLLAPVAEGNVQPNLVNIYDNTASFNFGGLAQIPIDTSYISLPIFNLLQSYSADSVVKCFPTYDPADTTFLRPDGKLVKLINLSRHVIIYFADSVDWQAFRTDYESLDSLSSISPLPILELAAQPTDLLSANQPYMFSDPTVGNSINVTDAWDITTGLSTQTIAVLDGGIKADHENLCQRHQWRTGKQPGGALGALTGF